MNKVNDAVLRGEMIREITEALNIAFMVDQHGDQKLADLYMGGSGVKYTRAHRGNLTFPIPRVPTDIDFFSTATPDFMGNPRSCHKEFLETIRQIADNHGYEALEKETDRKLMVVKRDGSYDQAFRLVKTFSVDEMKQIAERRNDLSGFDYQEDVRVELPVQFIPKAVHTMPTTTYEDSSLPTVDARETFAFRIARSLNPYREKSTDLLELYNMLHTEPALLDVQEDAGLIRLLVTVKIGDSLACTAEQIDFSQLKPEEIIKQIEERSVGEGDNARTVQFIAERILDKDGNIVPYEDEHKTNVGKVREHVHGRVYTPGAEIKRSAVARMMRDVYEAVQTVYGTNELPQLGEHEAAFLDALANPQFEHAAKNIRPELLMEEFAAEFKDNPDVEFNIKNNSFNHERVSGRLAGRGVC